MAARRGRSSSWLQPRSESRSRSSCTCGERQLDRRRQREPERPVASLLHHRRQHRRRPGPAARRPGPRRRGRCRRRRRGSSPAGSGRPRAAPPRPVLGRAGLVLGPSSRIRIRMSPCPVSRSSPSDRNLAWGRGAAAMASARSAPVGRAATIPRGRPTSRSAGRGGRPDGGEQYPTEERRLTPERRGHRPHRRRRGERHRVHLSALDPAGQRPQLLGRRREGAVGLHRHHLRPGRGQPFEQLGPPLGRARQEYAPSPHRSASSRASASPVASAAVRSGGRSAQRAARP